MSLLASEEKTIHRLGTMIDCSRNAVMNVEAVKRWIDLTSVLGYNTLLLYIEDTYEIDGEPYFGYKRGKYAKAELKEIDRYAREHNMEVIPCIQTLAHLSTLSRWPAYENCFDIEDILLVGDEQVYALIDKMFRTISECFSGRTVNIGVDEAHMLGRGRYLERNGVEDRKKILLKHIRRISELGKKYAFDLIMWSDMFYELASGKAYLDSTETENLLEYAKNEIPSNVELVYWDYYSDDIRHYNKMIAEQQKLSENLWFAGGLWSWCGFAPHNGYSIRMLTPAIQACRQKGLKNVFLTLWGDDGGECSRWALLPALYYASEAAKGNLDEKAIRQGFARKYGISWDDFMTLDLPGTPGGTAESICNPDKYLLYNDCFTGLMDSTLSGDEAQRYTACAEKLYPLTENAAWGYLFRTQYHLCRVLAKKADLGLRTRRAYLQGKESLRPITEDYKTIEEELELFYNAFRYQWFRENKASGFDVQDIRIGALIRRVKSCRTRIEDYIAGKTDSIEELEEAVLDFEGKAEFSKKHIRYNQWGNVVTANVLSWWRP